MALCFVLNLVKNDIFYRFSLFLIILIQVVCSEIDEESKSNNNKWKLEGKVVNQYTADEDWVSKARVLVDGGAYLGIVRSDGSFFISSIPSGSYVLEATHPLFVFDPVRVEINSKGKIRARALDNIQPTSVKNVVAYPLKLRCRGRAQYFQQREQWRLGDLLFNPMVLMMVLPLAMMFVLPKLINTQDPETQKEMQNLNFLSPKQNMPDLSEMMTNWFGSSKPTTGSSSSSSGTGGKKSIRGKPKQK